MNLNELTIKSAAEGLKNEKFTSVELTKACLDRIKKRNPEINAFITVTEEDALREAKAADALIASGKAGVLTGIPFSVKDAISTEGVRSTGSAKILDNYIPPYEATVVRKIRSAGGVLVGKNNCDAFGHGASNENSMYGPVRNPRDLAKVAGGSSGGSAAAVADDMCIYSIAEDTGGSIRQPASFCGVVGLRPSYGRNSRHGIMPMASSLDTVGPITKTVEDAALVMRIIAGQDKMDATTVPESVPDYIDEMRNPKSEIRKMKIGLPKEYFDAPGIQSEVKARTLEVVEKLKKLGCEITEVSLPHTKYSIAAYYIIVSCEDSSNLGRLDGIRYGVRIAPPPARGGVRGGGSALADLYAESREQGFPEEVKRRILIGTYALSAGYYDAYYKKAQQVRTLIRRDFDEVFKKVDVLITPTSPFTAFGIGEKVNDPLSMYLADVMVGPAALAGMPALSVPAGRDKSNLPIGGQVIGPRLAEGKVLKIGQFIAF